MSAPEPSRTPRIWFELPEPGRVLALPLGTSLLEHLERLQLANPDPANCALVYRARTLAAGGTATLPAQVDEAMPVWIVETDTGGRFPGLPTDGPTCDLALVIEHLSENLFDPIEVPAALLHLPRRPGRALPGPINGAPWRWHRLTRELLGVSEAA